MGSVERASDEVVRLTRRLERERRARREAEQISERTTRALYTKHAELQLLETVAVASNRARGGEEALQVAVDRVCAYTGWPLGHAWVLDADSNELVSSDTWHFPESAAFEIFRQASEPMRLAPGVGLPGRVLASGTPAWIIDVTDDPNFPRAGVAEQVGVKAAFAFPVGTRREVGAVLEFFSPEATDPDEALLALMAHIGTQVGHVLERTRVEEEFERARQEADAANRAKSAFLAAMSHEIRTPLNAVIGMTELLLGTELTRDQRELADVVRTSGETLLGVINGILDYSKIEAGRLEFERRPFVLRDCVETALEMVAASAAEKGLDVACLVDPQVPGTIVGDSTRVGQILVNLLSNAVKFTEDGEVVMMIGSQPAGRENAGRLHRLHFTVRDTGIGIPADRLDGLFESFSQVDASTTRRYGGTGLGLAISKRLCGLMGGEMWAESELGKGSAFHFTLVAEATSGPPPRIPAALRGKRLLVVDDNAVNREVVRRQARSWGIVSRETGSPTEALEWIRRGDPLDVAILDMQMPGMGGLALAREIRRYRDARALPLVMLTSLGRRKEDLEAGGEFAAFITKPIKASQLYNAVAAVVGAETAATKRARMSEPDARRGVPAQLRILLAEDNAVNQKLALLVLKKLGYRADVAVNGVEALEALRRRAYDVVLMDVEMPEMDGLDASRRIHHEWRGEERPRIVAMTANAMEGDRERCLAAGMDDYVSKPIDMDELTEALRRCRPRGVGVPEAQQPVSTAPHERGVLDPEVLEQLGATVGDRAFVIELVDTFLGDAPALLDTVRDALEDAEAEQLRRAAHTLKSNGRVFGAVRLAELCQALEARAKAGSLSGAAELVTQIEREYASVADALRAAEQEMT